MDTRGATSARPSVTGLRVERLKTYNQLTIRTLTPRADRVGREVLGYFTRWVGGKNGHSVYDPAQELGEQQSDLIWVGFVLVQAWNEDRKLWEACVLQVTENLELDFRGRYDRGQYWEVRKLTPGKKGSPIAGNYLGDCPLSELPPAICFLDVLRVMWHTPDLKAGTIINPMPPRVVMADDRGSPPPGSRSAAQEAERKSRPSPDDQHRMREDLRKRMEEMGKEKPINGTAKG